jgi:hypothetical protein
MSLGQHHVATLVAVDNLREAQIAGQLAQHVSLISRQRADPADIFDHPAHRHLGGVVKIFADAEADEMGRQILSGSQWPTLSEQG